MAGEVLPLLQRCPACNGAGHVVLHLPWCGASSVPCDCVRDAFCPLCEGNCVVEPMRVTWWRFDCQAGVAIGWEAGVR